MRYAEYPPSPRFAGTVERYWILEGAGAGAPAAILPDGRVELVFHYGATFRRHHSNARVERQPRALLAGPSLAPVVVSHDGLAGVAAIRLRPAAARALLHFPIRDVTDRIVDLEAIFPGARRLREQLASACDDAGRLQRLEDWLRDIELAPLDREVAFAVDTIVHTGGRVTVDLLARRSGVGRRQLERAFLRDVGLPPKSFARLTRLHTALRLVRGGDALADAAAACGYYDQAHMTLDFRHLAATSPEAWRRHGGELGPLFAGC